MKELIRVRVKYASRQQCCKNHKRPLSYLLHVRLCSRCNLGFRHANCAMLKNKIVYELTTVLRNLWMAANFHRYRNHWLIKDTFHHRWRSRWLFGGQQPYHWPPTAIPCSLVTYRSSEVNTDNRVKYLKHFTQLEGHLQFMSHHSPFFDSSRKGTVALNLSYIFVSFCPLKPIDV